MPGKNSLGMVCVVYGAVLGGSVPILDPGSGETNTRTETLLGGNFNFNVFSAVKQASISDLILVQFDASNNDLVQSGVWSKIALINRYCLHAKFAPILLFSHTTWLLILFVINKLKNCVSNTNKSIDFERTFSE